MPVAKRPKLNGPTRKDMTPEFYTEDGHLTEWAIDNGYVEEYANGRVRLYASGRTLLVRGRIFPQSAFRETFHRDNLSGARRFAEYHGTLDKPPNPEN